MSKINIEQEAAKDFANHLQVEVPAKSFRFHSHVIVTKYVPLKQKETARFIPSWNNAFSLTWTPGALMLTGDVGELSIVHEYGLASFEEGIRWVAAADFDYLMEKTNVKKVYDPEETYEFLLDEANRPVIDYILGNKVYSSKKGRYVRQGGGYRDLLRNRRKEMLEGKAAFEKANFEWVNGPQETDAPGIEDFLPEPVADFDNYRITERSQHQEPRFAQYPGFDIPDLWDSWMELWEEFGDGDPTSLMKVENRRTIRKELKNLCHDQVELVRFLRDNNNDDFYGCYRYSSRARWQIAAIKHGCEMLIEQFSNEKAA